MSNYSKQWKKIPPEKAAESPNCTPVVEAAAMSERSVTEFVEATHVGVSDFVAEKIRLHVVGVPAETSMVPLTSVDVAVIVAVPHEPRVGAVPVKTRLLKEFLPVHVLLSPKSVEDAAVPEPVIVIGLAPMVTNAVHDAPPAHETVVVGVER